ncbi:MAG: hypothetical protein Q9198_008005, partial [Flavoplaca austrocitrina]
MPDEEYYQSFTYLDHRDRVFRKGRWEGIPQSDDSRYKGDVETYTIAPIKYEKPPEDVRQASRLAHYAKRTTNSYHRDKAIDSLNAAV